MNVIMHYINHALLFYQTLIVVIVTKGVGVVRFATLWASADF